MQSSNPGRGSQYASTEFRTTLSTLHMRGSMGRAGSCYDGAVAESFFASPKAEIGTQVSGRERSAARLRILSRLHPVTAYRMIVAAATVPDMDRRIFGLETEYGVTCTYRGQRRLSPDEVARYLFRRVVSWGRSSNVFLRNGARLYLDVGSHPEYATPECDSVPDVVVHDRAGERILEGLLVDAEKRLHDEGIAGEIYLFKNNTDSAGNSYGCHENYLISRHGEFGRLADILIPFLVTRQLICGAGKVLQTPRGAVYCLSQYLQRVTEEEPGQPAVHHQPLARHGDIVLQPINVVVDLVVQLGVQVQLQRGHAALPGHLPVQVADADPADTQPVREQGRHSALAAAEIAVDDDRPPGCHGQG